MSPRLEFCPDRPQRADQLAPGNLSPKFDPNPFVSQYWDSSKPHPTKGLGELSCRGLTTDAVAYAVPENIRPVGWERNEVL